jgi:TetR/AcrR family transcriptional regulator
MTKRAYSHDDKQERRELILKTAADLFGEGIGALPSATAIAKQARLAKGTLYLYFSTKETIFSALLLKGWSSVATLTEQVFASSLAPKDKVDTFLSTYVSYLDEHRELLRLDAQRSALERNLEMETLIASKRAFIDQLIRAGGLIDASLGLQNGHGVQILLRTHALTCGLWQSFNPDTKIPSSAEFAVLQLDFIEELSQALTEYWRGAMMAQSE